MNIIFHNIIKRINLFTGFTIYDHMDIFKNPKEHFVFDEESMSYLNSHKFRVSYNVNDDLIWLINLHNDGLIFTDNLNFNLPHSKLKEYWKQIYDALKIKNCFLFGVLFDKLMVKTIFDIVENDVAYFSFDDIGTNDAIILSYDEIKKTS